MDRRTLLLGGASLLALAALVPSSWFSLKGWRIGRVSQFLTPGYSWCGRCQTTWAFVDGHSTYVEGTAAGAFPLCTQCWEDLRTPDARMPFYRALFRSWEEGDPDPASLPFTMAQLEQAVLAETSR